MTLDEAMDQLKALGNEKKWELRARSGAGENQFGVNLGDVRTWQRA